MRSIYSLLAAIAFCGAALWPMCVLAQQGTDCRRPLDPAKTGYLEPINLTGDWKDNSVNLDVTIVQKGDQVTATYKTAYKCAHPDPVTNQAVMLELDFDGTLYVNKISGDVYICQDTNGGANSARVKGHLEMTVGNAPIQMGGSYQDPLKGSQNITFTRTSPLKRTVYADGGIITTIKTAKLYDDASTGSRVRYVVPPGTRLIFMSVILDADGNPTWYLVAGSPGQGMSTNTGMIPATDITCPHPNPNNSGKNG